MQKIIDAGCDYFRYTVPLAHTDHKTLQEIGSIMQIEAIDSGEDFKEAKWQNFHGLQAGKVFLGESDTHRMINVSGQTSKVAADLIGAANLAGKCRRIDLQATVDYEEDETAIGDRLEAAIRAHEAAKETGRRFQVHKYMDSVRDTGLTAYSRNTSRYIRFYHAASGGHPEIAPSVYRAEAEYKQDRAPLIFRMYQAASSGGVLAASLVVGELRMMGLDEPWFSATVPEILPLLPDPRSDERTLNWLRNQALPAMKRMVSKGHADVIEQLIFEVRRGEDEKMRLSRLQERKELREKFFPKRSQDATSNSQDHEKCRRNVEHKEVEQRLPFPPTGDSGGSVR